MFVDFIRSKHQIFESSKNYTMKNIILTISLLFVSINFLSAQETTSEKFSLTVNITNFTSNKGKVYVAIYNKKEDFLDKIFKGDFSKIENKKATYVFKNLEKAEYAVSVFHDENDNNKMDTNFLGIPKEDYGCSNNATGFMGPPKYDDAKFQLTKNKTINIKL